MNIRWVEHVAQLGEMRNAYKILSENLKRRNNTEDVLIDGKIIL
jgi:hypothetical protein